jgi:Pyruvate/2-oxoacid:ferredoxin oxidoreductase delta subunit
MKAERPVRRIVRIDEGKCDGCGICVDSCHEGAIQIVDGKARLISESYCDGLGDCLAPCPRDAISIEVREADAYDEEAVKARMAEKAPADSGPPPGHGCPGRMAVSLGDTGGAVGPDEDLPDIPSELSNWPVQITLVPVNAPYLEGADLVIAADCTAFSSPDFHRRFLSGGRILLMGCPKLDDTGPYLAKLAEIFRQRNPRSVEVIYMEVPCCNGLVGLVRRALSESDRDIPLTLTKLGIRGRVLDTIRI